MIETIATVESNRELATGYRHLILNFDEEVPVRAGQFAMLKAHAAYEPLLRRAFAVYRAHGPRQLSFLYQVMGRGTEALSYLDRGGKVEALIPLGNSWPIENCERAIVVAGGIGSASVLMLCEELARAGKETQVFFGASSERVAVGCGLEDFRALNLPLVVTTDDGSLGERGVVTAPLERYLREGVRATIHACGPWVMMKRVAEIAREFDAPCFTSLEAPMGCGFGVCVGCVVAVKTAGPIGYGSYKRVCTDGSIFPADVIRWEVNAMTL
ncbi:MAG TPA: dihydroorotate dehydrogenase electron transfer subunit [Blastocatellia bacterium]|nr:dihydroorotate dehydrogenase electron transfer subunit [Blastocatellia bacterium]